MANRVKPELPRRDRAGWNGGFMSSMRNWMLGAALAVGALGMAAAPAQAAEFGVYIGGPRAYVPPSPGPGYAWVGGYYAHGYWVPGYWNFVGAGVRFGHPFVRGYVGPARYGFFDRHPVPERHFDRFRR
jgi:hypothetical protein